MNANLETLKLLQQQVTGAISLYESGVNVPMTPAELEDQRERTGKIKDSFVVGDFVIAKYPRKEPSF